MIAIVPEMKALHFGMRFRLAALILWAWASSAFATAPDTKPTDLRPYTLDRWNTDAGLPQSSVNAIIQSRDGYLWIATFGGVARFDGTAFTSITTGDRSGLRSDRTLGLALDRDGRVWIATEKGLSRYDRGTVTTLTVADGLPDESIRSVVADPDGSVWFGTGNGALGRVDSGGARTVVPPKGALGDTITKLVVDRGGAIWVAGPSGTWRYDPKAGLPVRALPGPKERRVPGVVTAAQDGGVWTLSDDGIAHLKETAQREFLLPPGASLRVEQIRALASDSGGILWLGDADGGIWRFRSESKELERMQSAGPGATTDLLVDREGSLWVGNRIAGLARVRPSLFEVFTTAQGLAQDNSTGIFEDSRGRVFSGGNCGGVAMRERGSATFRRLKDSEAPRCVWAIAEDSTGAIWFGGGGRGVARWRDGKAEFFDQEGWPKVGVRALFRDAHGTLWIGSGRGLASWDGASLTQHKGPETLLRPNVHEIQQSRDGALWLSTGNGVLRYEKGAYRSFTTAQGLPHNEVRSIHEDDAGAIWIATYGGGLARLFDGRIQSFTTADGLLDNFLSSVTEDNAGNLWLSSNRGVMRVSRRELEEREVGDRRRLRVLSYGRADGMLSAETNGGFQGAVARIDGRFWYPTLVGVAVIDPSAVASSVPPAVTLDRIIVNGQPHEPVDGLPIGPGAADLEFAYAGLSLNAPHAVTFRYRLLGWDNDWIDAATRRTANYSQLGPGSYRFSVQAANRDGVWSEPTQAIEVRVLPRYWQTWWFRTLAVLGIAILPLLRERSLRRHHVKLESLIKARTSELGDAVTRLSASEQRALQAKDEAVRASRAKSSFLANMSHELRTPLNAVIGFAQVLGRRDTLRGEDRESLRIIQTSGEHLLGLINDILSLSKIEAGELTLLVKPFDIKALLEGVRAIACARAQGKGVDVVFEIEPGLPAVVVGDEGRLRQVLINLLGNAVKFTSAGRVTLRAAYRDGRARFSVEDTGRGIAESEMPKLFSAFVQTESGESSREGTGLGLAISAQIVQLMGGRIDVVSRVLEGSAFSFEIPLPATEVPLSNPSLRRVSGLAAAHSHVRILVVDDVPENRLLLAQVLGSVGFEVQEASNGQEAIERFETFRPALILMDARMKIMDGREATQEIRERERERPGAKTVIIALTASAFEHEREQILEAGADDFVAKPFRVETIFDALARHLGLTYVYSDEVGLAAPTSEAAGGPLNVSRLAELTQEERQELHDALALGQVRKAQATAERIRERDDVLGQALLVEIRAFRLDDLLSLLEKVEPPESR
jgi:signal transduction histidine kinase/ligand-binding sensor domain-containing protein/DNA-binding response OmpR family regulator